MPEPLARDPHTVINQALPDEARQILTACCGSRRWVAGMLQQRPFATPAALYEAADRTLGDLDSEDRLEAITHHPAIGAPPDALGGEASRREQALALTADAATRAQLAEGNGAYREKFGFVFLVCATGKSAGEMLAMLRARLENDRATELLVASAELAKITRLRLERLAR